MAYFSFPYYFTIPNSEFRNSYYEFRNSRFRIVNCEVYVFRDISVRHMSIDCITCFILAKFAIASFSPIKVFWILTAILQCYL